MAGGWNHKQVAAPKKTCPEGDGSCDHLKNRELGLVVRLAALIQEPPVDTEPIASNQRLRIAFAQGRLNVVKINAFERLFHMELSWLAIDTEPVPIKHAVSRVTVLLNLEKHIASADGMESAARE